MYWTGLDWSRYPFLGVPVRLGKTEKIQLFEFLAAYVWANIVLFLRLRRQRNDNKQNRLESPNNRTVFEVKSAEHRMLRLRKVVVCFCLQFLVATWFLFLQMAIIESDSHLRIWVRIRRFVLCDQDWIGVSIAEFAICVEGFFIKPGPVWDNIAESYYYQINILNSLRYYTFFFV
jgi:hypothetical protein